MKTLHLNLSYRWYDMILAGQKSEEYRDMKWIKRICKYGIRTACSLTCSEPACRQQLPTDYTHVCFHRGYTKTTMLWSIGSVNIGRGNPDWGAPDQIVIIIHLDKHIN